MVERFDNIAKQNDVKEISYIKPEPTDQVEVEEILQDALESSKVKPELFCKEESSTNGSRDQKNYETKNNSPNLFHNKILININGVLYLVEKIPEVVVQNKQTLDVMPQTKGRMHIPGQCPKCGKILKQGISLKLHMQVCYRHLPSYSCENCGYKTKDADCWLLHVEKCGIIKKKSIRIKRTIRKGRLMGICLKCNDMNSPLCTNTCNICGSLKYWQCKICNKIFSLFRKARNHFRTKCKELIYYYCLNCDYKSVYKYRTEQHFATAHSHLNSNGISNSQLSYYKKKIHTDTSETENVCSLCGEKFEKAADLNRHTVFCRKYELFSQKVINEIKTEDLSQTDSNLVWACEKIKTEDHLFKDLSITNSSLEWAHEKITESKIMTAGYTENKYSLKQTRRSKRIAGRKVAKVLHSCYYCSYENRPKKNFVKHLITHVKKNEEFNSLPSQVSDKEINHYSNATNVECRAENKLNLQCMVVLKRLDLDTI